MVDSIPIAARRARLAALGALGLMAAPRESRSDPTPVDGKARIVIVGAGAAGLASASHLRRLPQASITLIDARRDDYYQPGFTLVGAGIKPVSYVVSTTQEYVAAGVEWVQEAAAEIDPEARRVTTAGGRKVGYDFLIVACGLELDYAAIDGMDTAWIGRDGVGSVYNGPEAAAATWKVMSAFAAQGGRAVRPPAHRHEVRRGAPEVHLHHRRPSAPCGHAGQGRAALPRAAKNAVLRPHRLGEGAHAVSGPRHPSALRAPTRVHRPGAPARHVLLDRRDDGAEVRLHPRRAPDARARRGARQSLPWQDGPFARERWLEVDRETLRHKRYDNVFGVGDIAGVPKGKTAASVKWQVPVAVDHLVGDISGKPSPRTNAQRLHVVSADHPAGSGHADRVRLTGQPLSVVPRFHRACWELWVSWVMKAVALKPTYISMLRGRT